MCHTVSKARAAIGVADEPALKIEIERLKLKHRIRLTELKASPLYDRPEFILEIV